MIMFLLGLLDSIIAISAIFMGYGHFYKTIIWVFSFYLVLKGVMFIRSFVSILDFIAGITLLLGLFVNLPVFIFWIIGIYLLQKGIFSLFSF